MTGRQAFVSTAPHQRSERVPATASVTLSCRRSATDPNDQQLNNSGKLMVWSGRRGGGWRAEGEGGGEDGGWGEVRTGKVGGGGG